jgi:hypothetical protein
MGWTGMTGRGRREVGMCRSLLVYALLRGLLLLSRVVRSEIASHHVGSILGWKSLGRSVGYHYGLGYLGNWIEKKR